MARVNRLIVEDGEVIDVAFGAIECRLPPAWCHPRAIRAAAEEKLDLLQWWRTFGSANEKSNFVITEAKRLIDRMTPARVEQEGAAKAQRVFDNLQTIRVNLDAAKPGLAKHPELQGAWSKANADWYGACGAIAQGLTYSDTATGAPVLPEGAEGAFGAEYAITDAVVATEWDGYNLGYVLSLHESNGGGADSLGALLVVGLVFAGLLALAIIIYIESMTENMVAASANIRDASKNLDNLDLDFNVDPLGGAGGAILALGIVGGATALVLKLRGKQKKPNRNSTSLP